MTNAVDGKTARGIVGGAMMAGYLPEFEDEAKPQAQAEAQPKPKRERKVKPKAAKPAKPVQAAPMKGLPTHVGTKRDTLYAVRGQVLDLLEANGWLVSSGPDALFFAQGFEDLVNAHFNARVEKGDE